MKITLTSDGSINDWGFIADYSNENREAFVESPHNYYNSMDQSWYVFGPPEATRMRVHFSLIDVEYYFDRVYLYDGYGNEVGYYTGQQIPDVWSPWCNGNYMRIRLTSDYSNYYWGFRIDNYEPDLPNKSTVTFLTDPTYIPQIGRGSATAAVEVSKPCSGCTGAAATPGNYTKHGLGWRKDMEVIPPEARVKGTMGYTLAPYLDWRDRGGIDWTTPIRDQEGCGSCVAFGSIATFEAALKIQSGNPDWDIDLSEQHLFSCGGGKCAYGWWIAPALDSLLYYGAPYESCFFYRAWDAPCSGTCGDWPSRSHRLLNWWWVYPTIGDIEYFLQFGPVVTAFDVYTDFFYYTGGVYRHTWGDYEGGHSVSIVGYDNVGGYWIVKNSWGPYWGEDGWFRIGFGECNIEQTVAAVVVPSVATITARFGTSPVGFSHLQDYDLPNGYFTATANPAQDGPLFTRWETAGGVAVSDSFAQTTTVNVWGDGTLLAVFATPAPALVALLNFDDYHNRMGSVTPMAPSAVFFFPHYHQDASWQTFVAIANPNDVTATFVDLSFYSSDGQLLAVRDIGPIGADAKVGYLLSSLGISGTGWIRVESDVPVVGLLNFDDYANRMGSMSGVTPSTSIYFPHFHQDPTWQTYYAIVNPSSAAASMTVTYYRADGSVVSTEPLTLAAYQKTGRFATGGTGWIAIESGTPIVGMLNFDDYRNRMGTIEYATPSTTLYFPHYHQDGSWQTYYAIANPSTTSASVTVTYYRPDGSIVTTETLTLNAHSKIGRFPSSGIGWIKVESSIPIVGMLNFDDYHNRMGSIVAVSQPLASVVFPHFHQDASWETYYAVVNVGQPTTCTTTYYAADGTSMGYEPWTLASNSKIGAFPPTGSGWLRIT
jgi:C1A family cysteine protease